MKAISGCLIGLVFGVSVWAGPLLEGRVRLGSGEPVADAQVRVFDLTDLRRGAIALAQTDGTGYFALPLSALSGRALPARFALGQNYPNPFNPSTLIPYQLAASAAVRLEVFNLLGQRIATLVDEERPAGFHTATWYATDGVGRAVGAGVYIYRMTVGVESQTGRMVLLDGQGGLSAVGVSSVMPSASSVGGSNGAESEVYGLIVSGEGLAPYVDSSFQVEAGMAPVELVVSSGHSGGKATDDDCAFCDFFGGLDDEQEEEEEETEDEEETDSTALVSIPDANLRAAIAKALGKRSGAPITVAEMKALTYLEAGGADISDLTGLEFATNLTELDLGRNQISDVSALRGLTNLTGLWLYYNRISDVSALQGLTKLTRLNLVVNQISDVSALRGLTKLTRLNLVVNQISDVSALRGLTKLTELDLGRNQIPDVSALAGLTRLTELGLDSNRISDVSALRGLTKLTELDLGFNQIPDVSALAGLTKLTELDLGFNQIPDVSALQGLTKLTWLRLSGNQISDVSALQGLTKLTWLYLGFNQIPDVSALAGLTRLTELGLRGNDLNNSSINDHIPAFERSGVTVRFDLLRESDFDIELVFLDEFSKRDKRVIRYAARRWMSIIREDLPDYTFTQGRSVECNHSFLRSSKIAEIPAGERIDDLRIYIVNFSGANYVGAGAWGYPRVLRETSLSVVGCMGFNLDYGVNLDTALHEIGHVLGIGTQPMYGFIQREGDVHFNGPRAIAAFDDAGGRNYAGAKVPMERDGGHWRGSVFGYGGELMTLGTGFAILSAITIQTLADVGYSVDVAQADPYTLPRAAAKVAAARPSTPDDRLRGREPEWTCSVGAQKGPIHVVDPQGRIIRTLHR